MPRRKDAAVSERSATPHISMELQVRAVSARNLLDKQTFGKQDPYCKLTLRGKSQRTRVHDNGRTCVAGLRRNR
jgi:Ca2+-dependent lipid-binding protein